MRLQGYDCCRQGGGNGKIAGFHDGKGPSAPWRRGHRFLRKLVHVGTVAFEFTVWTLNFTLAHVFFQDIWRYRRDIIEDGFVDAEILSQDRLGGVNNPVVNGKGCAFIPYQPPSVPQEGNNELPRRFEVPCLCVSTPLSLTCHNVPSSNANRYSFSSARPDEVSPFFEAFIMESDLGSHAQLPLESTRYLLPPRCRLGFSHSHQRPTPESIQHTRNPTPPIAELENTN